MSAPAVFSRDGVRNAREVFLISKGKTLEPYGMNRRDETESIYIFMMAFTYVSAFYLCRPIVFNLPICII